VLLDTQIIGLNNLNDFNTIKDKDSLPDNLE
jgi:hypothetical protein